MIADVPDVKREIDVKLAIDEGVYVTNFLIDRYGRKIGYSSAESAGVEIGDVILGVNGSNIKDSEDLTQALKFAKIGDTLNLTVFRKGKRKTIPVKLRRGI